MPLRRNLFLLFVFALAGCAAPTRHWSPFVRPRAEDWHGPPTLLLRYDANYDHAVSHDELEAGLRQDFWQADTNRDGKLDSEEVAKANLRRIRLDQSTAIPLIDWNHDGIVDFNEFAAGLRSLFDQYDADGDGVVTLKEMSVRLVPVSADGQGSDAQRPGSH